MFESDDFEKMLTDAVSNEAGRNAMKKYEKKDIITFLVNEAAKTENTSMHERRTIEASGMRGIPDAIESAKMIITEASLIANGDNRTLLTLDDVKSAHQKLFCRIWPFCR